MTPIVIELCRKGDVLVTDCHAIAAAIERVGAASVACVVTTTSCFAPRTCDQVSSCDSRRHAYMLASLCGSTLVWRIAGMMLWGTSELRDAR